MSGPFKLTSTLSLDPSEYNQALRNAAQSAQHFSDVHKKVMSDCARVAKDFGISAKDVYKQLLADEKQANKERAEELKKFNKNLDESVQQSKRIMSGATSGGMSGGFFAGFTILWDTFKTAASAAWSVVTSAATTAWDTIKSISSTVLDGILSSIDRVANQWRRSWNMMTSLADVQGIDFGALMSGRSANEMEVAIRRMQSTIGKATFGEKKASTIFDQLGLDANSVASMGTSDQLEAIGTALRGITNEAQQTALAMKLFGLNGQQALKFLDDMKENESIFNRYMTRLSEFDGAKIDGAKKSFTIISSELENIYNQIAARIAPIITNLVMKTEEWGLTSKALTPYLDQAYVKLKDMFVTGYAFGMTIAELLPKAFKVVANEIESTASYIKSLLQDLGKAMLMYDKYIAPYMKMVTNPLGAMGDAMNRAHGMNQNDSWMAQAGRGLSEWTTKTRNPNDLLYELNELGDKIKTGMKEHAGEAENLISRLFYGPALDAAVDAVKNKPKNGPVDEDLIEPGKDKKERRNPLGYAINTTGHFADPFTMRVAATDDNPVADKQTHSHLKEIHNTLKKDRVARAA